MKVLFLDIETTGLNPKDDWVWQVAYAKALQKEKTLELLEVVELVGRECISRPEVLQALEWADLMVAHKVDFEQGFIAYRDAALFAPSQVYCTMENSTEVCAIERTYYDPDLNEYVTDYKWPKLTEAIKRLGLQDQLLRFVRWSPHDAIFDVYAVVVLYARLEGLELKTDRHRRKTASLLKKYLTAKCYAAPKLRDETLRGILNQSRVYRTYAFLVRKWRQVHGFLTEKHHSLIYRYRNRGYEEEDKLPF